MDLKKTATALAIITGLSVGGMELEQANQLSKIHEKKGVNSTMVMVTASISNSHKKDVEDAIIEEYEKDGYVDYDNFELHQEIINNHYIELSEAGNIPNWFYDMPNMSEEEKIQKIHTSLKTKE